MNQRFTFEKWAPVAEMLDALIDDEHPIVPMGIALRVLLGVATTDTTDLARAMRGLRAMWHVFKSAHRPADLREGRPIRLEGETREFRPAAIKKNLEDAENRWVGIFAALARELGRPVVPDDREWLADQVRGSIEGVERVPELETAVKLAVEWVVVHGRRFLPGAAYQPKPAPNDAMDFDQLFVLGLPAILCTSDRKLVERVRPLGTPGSDRILYPAELLAHLLGEP